MALGVLAIVLLGVVAERQAAQQSAEIASAITARWELTDSRLHRDFPAMALDGKGIAWVAYIEHDGKLDVLRLARRTDARIENVAQVSEPGVIHQPAIAVDGSGGVWIFWGQVDKRDVMTLRGRRWAKERLEAPQTLATSAGSDTFADAGVDHAGRVWVVWQSLRRGQGDVFARWFDGKWSKELAVSRPEGGNWEPRLAFDGRDGAWVVFDSSRGGEFNLFLAHLGLQGDAREYPVTSSPEYEARASIARDATGFWIAAERGRRQWGKPQRGHANNDGLNGHKRVLLGHFDTESGRFTEVPVPDGGRPTPRPSPSANLPALAVDGSGNPWLAFRYFFENRWMIAVTRYDVAEKTWSRPTEVPDSGFGQDRHATLARDPAGKLWLAWPSDRRDTKVAGVAGVFVAELQTKLELHRAPAVKVEMLDEPKPYLDTPTAPRPRDQHHRWSFGGKTYTLVFGDLHRHTDFSNCRTGFDGSVVDHFRYGYDMAALDFMGTSDHTDVGKKYDPYEWWQTQRLVDAFYAPGKFTSLYAYEREQKYPWGHRNVVFAQRGAPLVYINRKLYQDSQWAAQYPVAAGTGEITPQELWDVLRKYGKKVALISHTGATAMGTDWDRYERIDGAFENTVEIYQGARVSYEGRGAPQPTVGLRQGQKYTADTASKAVIPMPPAAIGDFGVERNNGVYQHALARGHKLGVFASSDHVSQHASFGGVYVESVTREGIIEGFRARRTIAATDKVFVEFSANGKPMGSVFESGRPQLQLAVNGTAPIKRVTIVRNEADYKVFEPNARALRETFVDVAPVAGENRYYLRVEQADGSMAWSSPLWITAPTSR